MNSSKVQQEMQDKQGNPTPFVWKALKNTRTSTGRRK